MAMYKRPRPGGGRHPPPLAPTVSNFKPRVQWSNSGSSIFLYVNLPGHFLSSLSFFFCFLDFKFSLIDYNYKCYEFHFVDFVESTGFYRDQIEIKKDESTRTIQIQGQRPLSTLTKARFNEAYRVHESCDMTKMNTSFAHGLLTIEFPVVEESAKPENAVEDQRKTVQRPSQEGSRGSGLNESSLGRKKSSVDERKVGTGQEKAAPMANIEEPKTYKSAVVGKRAVPAGSSREKSEQRVKEGQANPSLGSKERTKEEKEVERKDAAQMGQQKTTVQKLKDEEARSTSTIGGSLKAKVLAEEEKVTERKRDGDIGQKITGQRVKEEGIIRAPTPMPTIGGSLDPKVHAKAEKLVERNGDGEIGRKLKAKVKIGLEPIKEEKHTKPVVGDKTTRPDKETAATNQAKPLQKVEEGVERTTRDVNGNVISNKHDKNDEKMAGDKVSEGEIQEKVKQRNLQEVGLVKETGDLNDNPEVAKPSRVDLGDPIPMKEETIQEGEDREKLEKSPESETDMDPAARGGRGMDEEQSRKYDISLLNVGAAALVIMGFGAYVFVPFVKMFY
ncbi:unnamed protein product [Thlaspi arvense]|uniref:SHSP domain-containing protein n=1 Tax=Thlaspi arvense TaxID=13288 RepID=A0AAU9RZV2_THLAR|nr:unnamed protein product [Thlaspi arvense]